MATPSSPSDPYSQYTFTELIHLVAPYPPGHCSPPLPRLPPENPWFILPAPMAPVACTWACRPNTATRICAKLHEGAIASAREVWAATPRDEDRLRRERNRKKKEHKARSLAKREDEALPPVPETGDEEEAAAVKARWEARIEELWQDPYSGRMFEVLTDALEMAEVHRARLSFVHQGFVEDYRRVHDNFARCSRVKAMTETNRIGLAGVVLFPLEHPRQPRSDLSLHLQQPPQLFYLVEY